MPKRTDVLQRFTTLRVALEKERTEIRQRLKQIDSAFGGGDFPRPVTESMHPRSAMLSGPRKANKMTIREAVTKTTAEQPLSVREIVDAVQKQGYRFQSTNPYNSVGAYLYGPEGRKHFKRVEGKFSPAK